jgi:thiamine biosynthesis lipoprotein
MNRRRFLALAAGAGGLAVLPSRRPLQRVERRSHALGTKVSLVALHEDRAAGEAALDAAFEALDRLEDVLSLYRPGSELRRLNRDGLLDLPHPDLTAVLASALDWSRRSGGAFDPTVQPLWESGDAEAARCRVDWRKVELGGRGIRLAPGQAVTLNGIAQGFAADRVRAVLRAHGVRQALADTGEISGTGRPWRIGIQHPRIPDAYVALAELEDRVMATSGDYATTSTRHLVDPATGRPPDAFSSVTILAPTGMEADALSTAVCILGPERGWELLSSRADVDALLVLKDGRTLSTPGFPELRA